MAPKFQGKRQKLSMADYTVIRIGYREGKTREQLSKEFGVAQTTISTIISCKPPYNK
jgi:hypothetical protein